MKKISKMMLYIILGLLLVGIVCFIIGVAGGGLSNLPNNVYYDNEGWHIDRFNFCENAAEKRNYDFSNFPLVKDEAMFASGDVEDLDIALGAKNIIIKEASDDNITVISMGKQKTEVYLADGVLHITTKSKEIKRWTDFIGCSDDTVTVFIPENKKFESMSYELGAVNLKQDVFVKCDFMDIELGAGTLQIKNLDVENMEVEVGAGSIVCENVTTDDLVAEIGAGSFEYSGDVECDLVLSCAMGNADIKLNGASSDHNLNYNVSMGTLEYDGKKIDGMDISEFIDNNSKYTIIINCSMGEVVVDFKEN